MSEAKPPVGMVNRNPLNLNYVPGQPFGAKRGLEGFGAYPSLEDGVASAYHQLLLDFRRGHQTPTELITLWAPPKFNDTAAYIKNVGSWTGLNMDVPVDLLDEDTAVVLICGMWREECGQQWVNADAAKAGVALMMEME